MKRHPNDERTQDGFGKGRKFKRFARRSGMDDPVNSAHNEGQGARMFGTRTTNPYPPGLRHRAWNEGYSDN